MQNEAGTAAIACLKALANLVCAPGATQQQAAAALNTVASAGGLAQVVRLMVAADPAVAVFAVHSTVSLLRKIPASMELLLQAGAIEAMAALLPGSQASPLPAAAALTLSSVNEHCPAHLRQQVG